MIEYWRIERVLELVQGDRELIEALLDAGFCERRDEGFAPNEVEAARLAHVLVHDLDVNWPGVEIILRLRSELVATRQQLADFVELWRQARADSPEPSRKPTTPESAEPPPG